MRVSARRMQAIGIIFLLPNLSSNVPISGSINPLPAVPSIYARDNLVREISDTVSSGSVNALKPGVWPGRLMITPRVAKGRRNHP